MRPRSQQEPLIRPRPIPLSLYADSDYGYQYPSLQRQQPRSLLSYRSNEDERPLRPLLSYGSNEDERPNRPLLSYVSNEDERPHRPLLSYGSNEDEGKFYPDKSQQLLSSNGYDLLLHEYGYADNHRAGRERPHVPVQVRVPSPASPVPLRSALKSLKRRFEEEDSEDGSIGHRYMPSRVLAEDYRPLRRMCGDSLNNYDYGQCQTVNNRENPLSSQEEVYYHRRNSDNANSNQPLMITATKKITEPEKVTNPKKLPGLADIIIGSSCGYPGSERIIAPNQSQKIYRPESPVYDRKNYASDGQHFRTMTTSNHFVNKICEQRRENEQVNTIVEGTASKHEMIIDLSKEESKVQPQSAMTQDHLRTGARQKFCNNEISRHENTNLPENDPFESTISPVLLWDDERVDLISEYVSSEANDGVTARKKATNPVVPASAAVQPMGPRIGSIVNSMLPLTSVLSQNAVYELEKRRNGPALRQLLEAPPNSEIWVETKTSGVEPVGIVGNEVSDIIFYYNAVTLDTTFDRPTSTNENSAYIIKQKDLQRILAERQPTTLIVKRMFKQITEEMLRRHFQQFGPVARIKTIKKHRTGKSGTSGRLMAYVRMATLEGEYNVLSNSHTVDGHTLEVRIPHNRLFVARVPDSTHPFELMDFFSGEISKLTNSAYVADAYFPQPFTQFAFIILGGLGIVDKITKTGDLLYKDRTYLNCSSMAIELDDEVTQVFNRKLEELAAKDENRSKVASLCFLEDTVRSILLFICKSKIQQPGLWTIRAILNKLNHEFLHLGENDLIQQYLFMQEHIVDMVLELAHDLEIVIEEPQEPKLNVYGQNRTSDTAKLTIENKDRSKMNATENYFSRQEQSQSHDYQSQNNTFQFRRQHMEMLNTNYGEEITLPNRTTS